MSQITLSFNLSEIPQEKLPLFLAHVAKVSMLYDAFVAGHTDAPPAESLPMPSFPSDEEETSEEKPLEEMTGQELRDRLSDLMGKPRGRKHTPKFPTKAALIAEIRRLAPTVERTAEEKDGTLFVTTTQQGERRMSEDSLAKDEEKKERKNPWAGLTPEQKAERIAKMQAARKAAAEKKTE